MMTGVTTTANWQCNVDDGAYCIVKVLRTDVKDDAPNKGKTISKMPFSPYNKITVDMLLHKAKMRQFYWIIFQTSTHFISFCVVALWNEIVRIILVLRM